MHYAQRERISDLALCEALDRANRGIVDADLGSGLVKQRVARFGQGRSGGYRMLSAFRRQSRAVFLYGFAKNERENIAEDELATARELAAAWLNADEAGVARSLSAGTLQEIDCGEET